MVYPHLRFALPGRLEISMRSSFPGSDSEGRLSLVGFAVRYERRCCLPCSRTSKLFGKEWGGLIFSPFQDVDQEMRCLLPRCVVMKSRQKQSIGSALCPQSSIDVQFDYSKQIYCYVSSQALLLRTALWNCIGSVLRPQSSTNVFRSYSKKTYCRAISLRGSRTYGSKQHWLGGKSAVFDICQSYRKE